MVSPTAALIDFCCDDASKTAATMTDNPEKQKLQVLEKQSEYSFDRAMGTSKGVFDYYSEDDRAKGERFALAMVDTEMIKTLTEEIYSFEGLSVDSTVVDAEGGIETVSLRIMKRVPQVSFIEQDQADVIQIADKDILDSEASNLVLSMAHDFLRSSL